jgi:RHS repeat-associated protein
VRIRFGLALILFAISLSPIVQGQISNVTGETQTPMLGTGRDYLHELTETIDPSTGALNLNISVPVPPGRKLTVPFAFTYNSNSAWHMETVSASGAPGPHYELGILQLGGWSYRVPSLSRQQVLTYPPPAIPTNSPGCSVTTSYILTDPSGGRHAFGIGHVDNYETTYAETGGQGDVNCSTSSLPSSATDGQYQAALVGGVTSNFNTNPDTDGTPLIVDPDGTVYNFGSPWGCGKDTSGSHQNYGLPTSIEDRNGNLVNISTSYGQNSTCVGSTAYISDALGRIITASTFGQTDSTVTVAGLSNPYTLTWVASAPSGLAISHHQLVADSHCGALAAKAEDLAPSVVSEIALPNGLNYTFGYDSATGFVNEITYPTGAYVTYTWGLSSLSAATAFNDNVGGLGACQFTYDQPVITKRVVTINGTQTLEQDFSYTTTWSSTGPWKYTQKTTTVVTKDLVRNVSYATVYSYVGAFAAVPPGFANSETVASQLPEEQTIQYYPTATPTGATLKTVTKNWGGYLSNIPMIACETDTTDNVSTSGVFYAYGLGDIVTDKKEYDFGTVTAANCTSNSAPASPLRETKTTYQTFAATPIFTLGTASIFDRPASVITYGSGTRTAETDYQYDQYTMSSATAAQHDDTNYGSAVSAPRGNVTTLTKSCFPSCTNAIWTYHYDQTGQTITKTDPCGNATCSDMTSTTHTTTYGYLDNYSNGCTGTAPPSQTNAYLTKLTDPLGHITTYCYGYNDGQLRGTIDPNLQTTTYAYVDSLARLTATNDPDGGQTSISYNDAGPTPTVTTSKLIVSGRPVTSISATDGVGHPIEKEISTDPEGAIYTKTTVDGLGRAYTTSNPYRSTSDPTYGITTYNYDALGRPTLVIPPDGNSTSNNVSTQYCGATTLVTDQAGHWRRSKSDGLARLVEVDEPNSTTATVNVCPGSGEPIWVTTYTYDGLDDLLSVVQGGAHNRSFVYDSLRRLTSSTNPETGTTPVLYAYDANSNVSTKTDARGITITYTYEPLNRLTARSYSNSDPSVSYAYDQTACVVVATCYNVGHRTSMSDAGGSESWAYDTMGREWGEQRVTNGITKTTGYTYDLNGDLATLTYPSGRIITYVTDSAGRTSSAQDVANNIFYIQGTCMNGISNLGVCFAPQGAIGSASVGPTGGSTWLNLAMSYNVRLQPNQIQYSNQAGSLMSLQYSFVDASSHNNGNVISITNLVDGTRSQQFTYDQVNRLVTGETTSTYSTSPTHCWGEAYAYDNATTGEYGNLTNINVASTAYNGCTQESLSVASSAANQITGFSYDASGNVLNDTHNSYLWNAESEIKTAAGVNYTYDGDGNRLQKSSDKIYWYGAGSEVLDESDSSGNITDEYVYFAGKRIAHRVVSGNVISYYGEDSLGSSRQIYTSTSALCYDSDFYPFGGERILTSACAQNYKFEGKERDSETNNDDFGARYYSSAFGRWTSPDWSAIPAPVPYANLSNPQTLNLYAMVSDNPETFADLDGHGTADWELPNLNLYNTDQSEDFRCAGSPVATCGSSPVAAVQSTSTDGQNQAQNPDQPQGENQSTQPSQPQQPDPNKPPPSWDPKQPLPDDPAKLGPDWKHDPDHKAPNDERWVNDKTKDKLDWHKGKPGEKGWKGKDHWHWNEHDWHFKPGDSVARVATVIAVGVVSYWVVSEASRILFPPRNVVPVP